MTPTFPKPVIRGTVTSKGQITLPKAVRDHLGATQGTRLEFVLEDGGVSVRNSTAADHATPSNPWQRWLGAAPLGDGQTTEEFMRDLRDRTDDLGRLPNPPEQRIIYLNDSSDSWP